MLLAKIYIHTYSLKLNQSSNIQEYRERTMFDKLIIIIYIQNMLFGQQYFEKNQGSKGIRQLVINLCTSTMMIHKITPSLD